MFGDEIEPFRSSDVPPSNANGDEVLSVAIQSHGAAKRCLGSMWAIGSVEDYHIVATKLIDLGQ
jgi:hypothetical protein